MLALLLFSSASADDDWHKFSVANTFDNRPFAYLEKPLADRPGYKILRLKYPSPTVTAVEQNNTVPADYYLPDGIRPGEPRRPAVICLHILDGNDALTEMLCATLALRGVPAIAFKLPYYGERGFPEGPMALAKDPKLLAGALNRPAATCGGQSISWPRGRRLIQRRSASRASAWEESWPPAPPGPSLASIAPRPCWPAATC